MKATRLGILALALLLSGCGDDEQPSQSPQEKPLVIEQPVALPEQALQPQPTSHEKAPAVAKKPIPKPEPLPSLPPTPVDLSVSQEMLDELHLGETAEEAQPQSLLPPLFEEKPKIESNFQLNGRLLLNEQLQDDYVKSVDGAELQLQYKH